MNRNLVIQGYRSIAKGEENKMLRLVKQNKEVFINRKTLYHAFADMVWSRGD